MNRLSHSTARPSSRQILPVVKRLAEIAQGVLQTDQPVFCRQRETPLAASRACSTVSHPTSKSCHDKNRLVGLQDAWAISARRLRRAGSCRDDGLAVE